MKTNRFTNLIAAAFGLAAFSTAGCTEKEKIAEAPLPPAKAVATTVPGPAIAVPVAATASPDVASANWADIKERSGSVRSHPVAWLDHSAGAMIGSVS